MTVVHTAAGLAPVVHVGTTEVGIRWNEREAMILASIRLGIEQATRGEGTELTDDDLKTD